LSRSLAPLVKTRGLRDDTFTEISKIKTELLPKKQPPLLASAAEVDWKFTRLK